MTCALFDLFVNCSDFVGADIDGQGLRDWHLHECLLTGVLAKAQRSIQSPVQKPESPRETISSQTRDNYPSERVVCSRRCLWDLDRQPDEGGKVTPLGIKK